MCWIYGSHRRAYKEYSPLGCNTCVVWKKFTDTSEECTALTFMVEEQAKQATCKKQVASTALLAACFMLVTFQS
jgi:hypothetical protein